MQLKPTPYRTVFTVLVIGGYMLIGAWLLRATPEMFSSLITGLTMLGGVQGFKAGWEHHVNAKAKAGP